MSEIIMARKKTQEQFEKEVHEKYPQIQIRGKYNGSNERVNVHCNIDEYDWDAYPNNLLTYGCPCCNGRYHFAGKDDNGIPLVWRYLSDYKNMNQDEIDSLINYKLEGKKQVICLNTKDVFDNALVACKWCGLESKLPIQRVCRGETKTAGMHPLTKEKLSWMYYKDYKEIFGEAS